MSAQTDPWGYLAALAVAGGYLYWRRKNRSTSTNTETKVPEMAEPVAPVMRRLDIVVVRCEHLDHHPGYAPTAPLTRENSSRDVRALRRLGWGGSDHSNLCHYHNPGAGVPLDKVHVLCDMPNCGERDVLRTSDLESAFGRLAGKGWVNTDSGATWCLYCSGRRDRPRW